MFFATILSLKIYFLNFMILLTRNVYLPVSLTIMHFSLEKYCLIIKILSSFNRELPNNDCIRTRKKKQQSVVGRASMSCLMCECKFHEGWGPLNVGRASPKRSTLIHRIDRHSNDRLVWKIYVMSAFTCLSILIWNSVVQNIFIDTIRVSLFLK